MSITIRQIAHDSPDFKDCLFVRFNVFIDEQKIPADIEIEYEDECIHWVAYSTDAPGGEPKPVGNIRLVRSRPGSGERFIHLGRTAVVKEYRRRGIAKALVETAVQYALENPFEVVPKSEGGWDGRLLVNAQISAMKAWEGCGFVHDPSLGEWDEGGIPHVGMWRTVQLTPNIDKSP